MRRLVKKATAALLALLVFAGGIGASYVAAAEYEPPRDDALSGYGLPEGYVSYQYYLGFCVEDVDEETLAHILEVRATMNRQAPAVEAYNILIESFLTECRELVFPDTYAGAFIGDHYLLVIQVTSMNRATTDFYVNLLGTDAPIAFKEVEFSLNQLNRYGEAFVESINARVVAFGVDVLNNSFQVLLDKNCEENVRFVSYFNQNIQRVSGIPINLGLCQPSVASFNLWGGVQLTNALGSFSVGLTGMYNGRPALLTTGHAFIWWYDMNEREFTILGRDVFRPGITGTIGTLQRLSMGNATFGNPIGFLGSGDWAIVSLNATGERHLSNVVNTIPARRVGGTLLNVPINTMIIGSGNQTPQYTGYVTTTTMTSRIVVRNLFYVDVRGVVGFHVISASTPRAGDSGGPLLFFSNNRYNLVGVFCAAPPTGAWPRRFYFSPLMWVPSSFVPRTQ